jgi:trans-aconitate methyltransferase
MKKQRLLGWWALPLLALSLLAVPSTVKATDRPADSPEVSKLLAEAKTEAVELKNDSANMESFTRSGVTWHTYADHISMVKEHVNAVGRLLGQLNEKESQCAPWQRTAIERITPLLRELAANTESTINHLKDNQSRVHLPPFKDYVRANYELASDLAALVTDFVDYGTAREKVELLEQKQEIT